MKLFQCTVRGPMQHFDGSHTFFSRRVFRTYEEAELYLPKFHEKCMTDLSGKDLTVLESIEHSNIVILECEELGE